MFHLQKNAFFVTLGHLSHSVYKLERMYYVMDMLLSGCRHKEFHTITFVAQPVSNRDACPKVTKKAFFCRWNIYFSTSFYDIFQKLFFGFFINFLLAIGDQKWLIPKILFFI
jgi:hypothetical protein